jgi:hypothetical protein
MCSYHAPALVQLDSPVRATAQCLGALMWTACGGTTPQHAPAALCLCLAALLWAAQRTPAELPLISCCNPVHACALLRCCRLAADPSGVAPDQLLQAAAAPRMQVQLLQRPLSAGGPRCRRPTRSPVAGHQQRRWPGVRRALWRAARPWEMASAAAAVALRLSLRLVSCWGAASACAVLPARLRCLRCLRCAGAACACIACTSCCRRYPPSSCSDCGNLRLLVAAKWLQEAALRCSPCSWLATALACCFRSVEFLARRPLAPVGPRLAGLDLCGPQSSVNQ